MKKHLLLIIKAFKQREKNQIFRTMKFTFLFLFLLFTQAQASTMLSQNVRVNIKTGHIALKEIMTQIESQTDYLFVYSDSEINVSKTVNVKEGNTKVSDLLNTLKENGITYTFSDNYISLHQCNGLNDATQQIGETTVKVIGTITVFRAI